MNILLIMAILSLVLVSIGDYGNRARPWQKIHPMFRLLQILSAFFIIGFTINYFIT